MIGLCLLLFAASAMGGLSIPKLTTQTRDGRQAHVRFISQLANPGPNINLNSVINNPYTTQPAQVSVKVGSTTVVLTDTVNQGTTTSYVAIDTGNNGQASVTLTFQTTTPQTVNCPSVLKNDRVTFVLTQFVNPASPISSGSCSVGSGFCTNGAFTPGSVTITCTPVTESLSTGPDCATVPVRFYNLHTGCPLKYRLSVTAGVSETLDLSKTVPTSFGTGAQEQLERKIERSIGGTSLTPSSARFIDAFIDASGALTVQTLETGFLNVVNLAYRENPVGTRDNDFVIVVSQSNNLAELSKVVHFQAISAAQPLSNWIEVPVGSYFLHVFDNGDSETAIFGDNTGSTIVPATAVALVVSSAVSVAANDVKIFRITNNNGAAPITAASLFVNAVSLNNGKQPSNGDPTTVLNDLDTTRHVIWNNVLGQSLKLASPDSQCCNYAKDFDDNQEEFSNPGGSFEANTLVPGTLTGSFSVFQSTSACTALGSPVVSDSVTLSDSTGTSECADQGIFLFARPVTVNSQVCTSTSTGASTCSSGISSTASTTVFVSTTTAPSDTSSAATIDLSLTVPLCDCAVVAPSCVDLTCEEERTLQQQVAAVAGLISSSTSAVTAAVTASQNALGAVLADTNADVGNTNSTLLAAINTRTSSIPTIASDVSALRSDIRRLRNEVGDVEDAVDDIEDAVDDVQDAVDDL